MLDILEIAEEKGFEKGNFLGLQEGKNLGMLEGASDMVIYALLEKFNHTPIHILQQIRTIQKFNTLKLVFRQTFRCDDIKEFETILNQIVTSDLEMSKRQFF
jgi:hypothetical protein